MGGGGEAGPGKQKVWNSNWQGGNCISSSLGAGWGLRGRGGGKIKTTRKGNQVTQIQFLYLMPVISGPASSNDQR